MKGKAAAGPQATTATKRIKKEIADLAKEDLGDIQLIPNEANIFAWRAKVPGPVGSPYEGGLFEVDIRVPDDYPFGPPKLQFLTKVYHCNIAPTGAICLDLLKTAWTPALSLYKVILSLSSLLTDPNPADPLVPAIAREYKSNRKKHDATARDWVKQYALPPPSSKPPAPPAPAVTSVSASTSRPRVVHRPASGQSNAPPAPVTGRRRRISPLNPGEPIDLASDDDDALVADSSDVEILDENGRTTNQQGASTNVTGTRPPKSRPNKKARTGAGVADEEIIVIDD